MIHPMQGNSNSGIRELFSCGTRNSGLWNPKFSFSGIHVPLNGIQNPVPRLRNSPAWSPESKTYYLLAASEVITGKSQTSALIYCPSFRSLRFPCNGRTDEINKLFIIWLFYYGPEPAIN